MKENFSCTLTGKRWWKPFIVCVALSLAIMIPSELASLNPPEDPARAMAAFFFTLALEGLLIVVQAAFSVVLMALAYPTVAIKGKPLAFTGKIGEYVKINILGFLLCLVTLGFYIPAYARKIVSYIAEHSECEGTKASFRSKTGTLVKYYILAFVLPLVAVCVAFGILAAQLNLAKASNVSGSFGFAMVILYLAIFIVIIPFLYLAYRWSINFAWKGLTISWDTHFCPSCGFLLAQLGLLVVTCGIAWPVVFANIYRYFAGKTVVRENGAEMGRLGFGATAGKGFTLLWGQALLTLITCGIYLPWAYANCMRFFINNTYYEGKQELIGQA